MDARALVGELYPWACGLYLLDCLLAGRRPFALFERGGGGAWRLRFTLLRAAGVLPWGRYVKVAIPSPALTGEGVLAFPPAESPAFRYRAAEARRLSCNGAAAVERERAQVRVGRVSLPLGTAAGARDFARRLRRLCAAPPGERARLARGFLRRGMNAGRLRRRVLLAERALRPLTALNAAFFAAVFLLLPLHLLLSVPTLLALAHGALIALLVPAIALESYRVHRRLFPGDRGERALLVATALFFPVSAAHTAAAIAGGVRAGFDWVAVAAQALPSDEAARVVAAEWERLGPGAGEAAGETGDGDGADEYRAARREAVRALAAREGFPLPLPADRVARADAGARLWCPVCYAEYGEGVGACADCGTGLRPFG